MSLPSLSSSTILAFPKKLKEPLQRLYQEAQLKVVGGRHTGAWLEFPAADLRVGSALMNDVALLCDEVAPHHARLRLADAMGQKLVIEALEGDVIVNQTDVVRMGQMAEVPLPTRLQMARAVLEISPRTLSPNSAKWGPTVIVGAFGVLGILLFGGYWTNGFNQGFRQYKRNAPLQVAALPPSTALPQIAALPQTALQTAADPASHAAVVRAAPLLALESIRTMIDNAGLKDKIMLAPVADGSIVANGMLDSSDVSSWRGVLQGIDNQKLGRPVINNVVVDTSAVSAPAIASIWFDKSPRVITKTGEVAGVGDKLAQNWRVVSIDNGVVLNRNGRTVRITP